MNWQPAAAKPPQGEQVLTYTSLHVYEIMWHDGEDWQGDLRGTADDPERVLCWAALDEPPECLTVGTTLK